MGLIRGCPGYYLNDKGRVMRVGRPPKAIRAAAGKYELRNAAGKLVQLTMTQIQTRSASGKR